MTGIRKIFAVTTLLLLCSAPFAQEDESDGTDDAGSGRVCVNIRSIRSFDAFDDQNVYVREGSSRHFLFRMRHRCPGLRHSYGIAVKDRTSRICSDSTGEIVYSDRAGGRGNRSCPVETIIAVESKAAAEALVKGNDNADQAEDDR
jgi:hypothetical protein